MGLEVRDVDTETDFPVIARSLIEAYESPLQPFVYAFFPIHGSGPEAREESIQEAGARIKLFHELDPASHWIKAVDTDTGAIAGAAIFNIYDNNPFENPQASPALWFPDDSSRDYANQILYAAQEPRSRIARRPHIFLLNIFTHPKYRRQGVGQRLMNWGMKKADELGLEMFLDATVEGRPLYEVNGFVTIEDNHIHPQMENPDDRWREIDAMIGPVTLRTMWRPAGGKYVEGKTVKPWEQN